MVRVVTTAIVLQTRDYAEWDRIVSLMTGDHGRVAAIAKAAKRSQRRFGSTLEPFTLVEAHLVGREQQQLARLEQCRLIAAYPALAADLRKLAYGTYVLELVHLLAPERQPNDALFALLRRFVDLLHSQPFREDMIRLFELRLLGLLGYQPQLHACVACRQPFSVDVRYRFSVRRGGIVCSRCAAGRPEVPEISSGTIRVFQQAQQMAVDKLGRVRLSAATCREGGALLEQFLAYHVGVQPKSLKLIRQLS